MATLQLTTAWLCLSASMPSTAAAQGALEAPDSCATYEDLVALVRGRMAPDAAQLPPFTARVVAEEKGFRGELTVASSSPRALRAETCVEVLEAMSIVVALRAEEMRSAKSRGAFADESPQARVANAEVNRPLQPGAVDSTGPLAQRRGPGLELRFGLGGVVLSDLAPGTAFGLSASGALQDVSASYWFFGVGVDRAETGNVGAGSGAMWTRLTVARLTGCIRYLDLTPVRVSPCLQLSGGVLDAEGVPNATFPTTGAVSRPWVGLGPGLRAEVRLSRHFSLSGIAVAPLRLVQQDFRFEAPDTVAYAADLVSHSFGLSAEIVLGGSNRRFTGMAR